jgi:hypothetical protein
LVQTLYESIELYLVMKTCSAVSGTLYGRVLLSQVSLSADDKKKCVAKVRI